MRWLSLLALFATTFVATLAHAQSITIQGRVSDSAGNPLNGASTIFQVQILAPNASRCVLYDETQTLNLTGSNGLFSINLNNGSGTQNAPANYTLEEALSNRTGFSINSAYCQGATGTVTYSPAATDNRKVVILFKDPGTMTGFESIPEMDLNPIPFSIESRSIGGYPAASLLRVENTGVPGSVASLTSGNFTELQALLAGTSNNYMSSTAGTTTGARLPTVSGDPATPAVGSIWFDTTGSGALKYKDSSGTIQTVGTGTGAGTITSVTAGTGMSGGGSSGAVTLNLGNTAVTPGSYGSASAMPVITVDAQGRITAASTTAVTGTLPSGTSGEFLRSNGTAWSSQQIKLGDIKNTAGSGALFTGTGCSSAQALYWDSGTDEIKCQAIGGLNTSVLTAGTIADARLADVGTAGTYRSVTVDGKGRVTAGTNPTTLAGYGITDALVNNAGGVPTLRADVYANLGSAGTAGRLFVSTDTLTLYRDNGSTWDIIGAAGAGSSLSGVTAGSGLSGGGTSGNVTISMPAVGTAGTYFKVTTDAQGRVSSGAGTLLAADIPNLDWAKIATGKPTTLSGYGITDSLVGNAGGALSIAAGNTAGRGASSTAGRIYIDTQANTVSYDTGSGWQTISSGSSFSGSLAGDVTGTQGSTVVAQVGGVTAANVASGANAANAATNLNTASTIVKRDASGNFSVGAISQSSAIFRDGTTNTIGLAAPASVTSYNLTLPAAAPSTNGQVLSSSTAGVLSWTTPVAATSVSVTAPVTNSGTATAPNIGMPAATPSVDGYLSSANFTAFTNKLSSVLNSAMIFVGNGSNVATGVAPSGDISMTNTGAFTVNAIKGKTVTAAPTTAGQVLRYDGTNLVPNFISMGDLRSTVTGASALTTGCTAGQTLTWNSGTDNLQCQSISIAAASQITGLLPIANGGTGANSTSQGFVFAGPASGGAGAPSFRAIAASDLPASASYWNAATGGINYAGGNVGVGTTAPAAKLQVAGDILADTKISIGSSAYADLNILSNGTIYQNGGDPFTRIQSGGAGNARVLLQSNGPSGGPTVANHEAGRIDIGGRTPAGWIDQAASIKGVAEALWTNASTPMALTFSTTTGTTMSERLRIAGNGNVGIGTASPAVPFHVHVPTGAANAGIRTSWTDTNGYGEWTTYEGASYMGGFSVFGSGYGTASYQNALVFTAAANNAGTIQFRTRTGGSYITPVVISNAGNLGVGTTSPQAGLDVKTTGANSAIIVPRDTVANRPTTGVNGMLRYASDANVLEAYVNGAWASLATIGGASSFTTVNAGAGTAAAPSHSFSGDSDTGFYNSATDTIGVSAGGAKVFDISSTGLASPTAGGASVLTANGTAAAPTYSFAGDLDTGWWRPAADTMAASTGGVERMRILASGSVGIGTTSPANKLHVSGGYIANGNGNPGTWSTNGSDILLNTGITASSIYLRPNGDGSGVSQLSLDTVNGHRFFGSAATEVARINPAGNVGIGTTNPTSKLTVAGAAMISGTVGGGGGISTVTLPAQGTYVTWNEGLDGVTYLMNHRGAAGGGFKFGLFDSAGAYVSTAVTIDGAGKVGIGTTAPSATLEVNGTIKATGIDVAGHQAITQTRTLPTTVDDTVDIGGFQITHGGQLLHVGITVSNSGFSTSKDYVLARGYCQWGSCASGTWYEALPLSSSGSYNGNDFALDVRHTDASATLDLRLRRKAGATAGTAVIALLNNGLSTTTFTASSATASVTAPTLFYGPTALTQVGGKVGIGTSAPSTTLEVKAATGAVSVTNTTNAYTADLTSHATAGAFLHVRRDATNEWFVGADPTIAGLTFRQGNTSNTPSVTMLTNGNVGIGTSAPNSTLAVDGGGGVLSLKPGASNDHTYMQFFARSATPSTRSGWFGYGGAATTTSTWANEISGAAAHVTTTNGNINLLPGAASVGIGTTTPTDLLHVAGRIRSNDYVETRTGATSNLYYTSNFNYRTNGYAYYLGLRSDAAYAFMNVYPSGTAGDPATPITSMAWHSNGNVGIGTVAPSALLNIASASSSDQFKLTNTTAGGKVWELDSEGSGIFSLIDRSNNVRRYSVASAGDHTFYRPDGGTSVMTLTTAGNVGIGTTAPAGTLDVQGGPAPLRLRNNAYGTIWKVGPDTTNSFVVYNASDVGVYMSNGQNAWSSTSDIRLKKNLQPLDGALEKLRRISGYTYNYKHESDQDPRHVGVIAQDVQAVLPEAVSEKEGVLAVRYTELIPLVINALKELSARFENELASLRGDVDKLQIRSQDSAKMKDRLVKVEAENARLKAADEAKARELASLKKRMERLEKMLEKR